ncbi:hypothetical protein EDC01DRAFT_410401 [Geopyxis carbonaria]|nr:hypothetical protein EDC01DRAFT_410401 [Geopyxis carbonaria]
MDPLSISASVVGLLGITAKMANFLQGFISATVDAPDSMRGVLSEAESMRAIFEQLQWFLAARIQTQKDRTSMILVDHLVTALTGCVMTFDRLQCELESFFDQQNGDKSIGNRLLWDRLRWATKETTIKKHVTDLQKHKSTLSLMLTILQSHSTVEAESCLVRLCDTVEDILQSNRELAARMQHFELSQNTSNLIAISSDSAGVTHLMNPDSSETIARRSFEETLWKTSAYSHARERVPADFCSVTCRRSSLFSRISSGSGVSLSDISNISVIGIPITASDITHHSLYSSSVHSGSSPSILTTRTTSVTEVSSKDQSIDRSRSTVINISSTITTNSSSSRSPLKKQSVFPFNNDWGFYKVPQPDVNK